MSKVQSDKQFKFSVVMPVYNKEEYLEEAFQSLVNQTIGFEGNIQVILINDGSVDSSADICETFAQKYPMNVVYINQENKGVSSARNRGLQQIAGDYVSFFDADDIWDLDVFEKADAFFQTHSGEVDVLSVRLVQFGDITTVHPLDYKYEKTCVVDLEERPDFIQPMIGNCIFTSDSVRGRMFDENLHFAEDTLFVNDILLEKRSCGILADAEYHYRKMRAANTASLSVKKQRYESNNSVYLSLYRMSKERYGAVCRFITILALYELCWQIFVKCEDDFTESDRLAWHEAVFELLSEINAEDIWTASWLSMDKRVCLLKLKYGEKYLQCTPWDESGNWMQGESCLFSLKKFPCIVINGMKVRGDRLVLNGVTRVTYFDENADLRVRLGDEDCVSLELAPFPPFDQTLITGEVFLKAYRFSFSLPLQDTIGQAITIVWQAGNGMGVSLPIRFTLYGGAPIGKSYSVQGDVVIRHPKQNTIKVVRKTLRAHASSEYRLLRSIFASPKLSRRDKMRISALRLTAKAYQQLKRKPIWIFIDREYKAGDSAEALYSYACKQPLAEKVDLCFLQKKSSLDYPRLKSLGTVLKPGSLRYRIKFLSAQKIFSGHHDALVTNPFGNEGNYFADMYLYDFYNLSHGTLQGDLSAQLNRHVRPIHRFFVSTEMERRALLDDSYGYTEEEIRLDGMCRYDVYDKSKTCKKLLFMPTWRASLAGKIIPGTREREYVDGFEDSDYCRAYNDLINDERLLDLMRQAGYTGEFYVHPNYEKQADCFHGNDVITVSASSANYNNALSEGALLITDYSGISFDFAYMRKPVLYYHFDNLFDGGHSYKDNYFSYEEEGFGPVCGEQNELIEAIGELLVNDCEMAPIYRERADSFFAFSDKNNCERVFNEIVSE